MRSGIAAIAAVPTRLLAYYVGSAEKNTIEYWQRFVFYVITFTGIAAGTLCIIPAGSSYYRHHSIAFIVLTKSFFFSF